jgi:hypothetical protein
MKASGCSFFFAEKKKEPKKNLSAASDSVKVSGLAWAVLPEPANADFFRLFTVCGCILFFPRQQISFGRNQSKQWWPCVLERA